MRRIANAFDDALAAARAGGLMPDTNVLAAWAAGDFDPSLLGTKRLEAYGVEDFELLSQLVADAGRLVTTPHLLAEASNVIANCAGRLRAYDALAHFAGLLGGFDERHLPARDLWEADAVAFARLGVADAAVARLAGEAVVLSADAELVVHLHAAGRKAVNFNHLRSWLFEK